MAFPEPSGGAGSDGTSPAGLGSEGSGAGLCPAPVKREPEQGGDSTPPPLPSANQDRAASPVTFLLLFPSRKGFSQVPGKKNAPSNPSRPPRGDAPALKHPHGIAAVTPAPKNDAEPVLLWVGSRRQPPGVYLRQERRGEETWWGRESPNPHLPAQGWHLGLLHPINQVTDPGWGCSSSSCKHPHPAAAKGLKANATTSLKSAVGEGHKDIEIKNRIIFFPWVSPPTPFVPGPTGWEMENSRGFSPPLPKINPHPVSLRQHPQKSFHPHPGGFSLHIPAYFSREKTNKPTIFPALTSFCSPGKRRKNWGRGKEKKWK